MNRKIALLSLTVLQLLTIGSHSFADVLLASSTSSDIRVYSDQGALTQTFAGTGSPTRQMAMGPDGAIYFTSPNGVFKANWPLTTAVQFTQPVSGRSVWESFGITFGPDGNLYATTRNGATADILKFNGTTGAYISNFVPNGTAGLSQPFGLDFGSDGSLYVAMTDRSAIARYNASTGAYMGDSAIISFPRQIEFSQSNQMFVLSDVGDVWGNGFYDATQATGFTFGPANTLLVADQNSIRRYSITNSSFMGYLVAPNNGFSTPAGILYVPEPSSAFLCLGSLILLGRRRMRGTSAVSKPA
jgi:DNA-binding beta-propeller fold protein YncE